MIAIKLLYVAATCIIKVSFCITILPLLRSKIDAVLLFAARTLVSTYSLFYIVWILVRCSGPSAPVVCFDRLVIVSYVHAAVLITADLSLALLSI